MDLFLAGCQGLGLALAAGAFSGASGRRGTLGIVLLIAGAIGGGVLFAWALDQEDHPAWPGFVVGAALAAFAYLVTRAIAEGAGARAGAGGYTGALIALAALLLAGLSLLVSPVALVALIALIWVGAGQRRRGGQKYEGLRTLR